MTRGEFPDIGMALIGGGMDDLRLNLFQRVTRRWERVYPYNAAQVMRVAGRADPARVAGVWAESLRALGLGSVRVGHAGAFRHEVLNGQLARYPLAVLPPGASLEGHLSAELNRPFDDPGEPPLRPFVLQQHDDFWFGVVYQHWVADSVSIRAILREWFARMYDPGAARRTPLRQPRGGYWRLFSGRGDWRIDETLLAGFRSHMRHRRVRKVKGVCPEDYPVRVTLHAAPDGLADDLRARAREAGVKVHDVLMAALAVACAAHVPAQRRRKRPDLSVGSIVDLRPHAGTDLSDTFGLFLGFTSVVCREEVVRDWPRLVRSVAQQNRASKKTGLPQASMLWMLASLALDPLVPDENLYRFYRKELPMAGGLSNVNLNDTWAARYHPEPLRDYLRVSPTGPMVPLAVAATTLGSHLRLAITCRRTLLPESGMHDAAESFIKALGRAIPANERL